MQQTGRNNTTTFTLSYIYYSLAMWIIGECEMYDIIYILEIIVFINIYRMMLFIYSPKAEISY